MNKSRLQISSEGLSFPVQILHQKDGKSRVKFRNSVISPRVNNFDD